MKPANDSTGVAVENRGSIEELLKLLQAFDTAMLTTLTPMGFLRARPMGIQKPVAELPCDLWFVTSLDSAKSEEIAHEHQVGVSCFRRSDHAYLSVSAIARIRREPELVQRLFEPSWRAWFPEGPSDPSIALIEMRIERGEYWSPDGGPDRVLYETVKTLVRGDSRFSQVAPPKKV